nr:MAG TPA: hypothetical protein [Bacteriophage sp.]
MDLLLYLTLSPASGLLLKTIEGKAFMTPELVSWLMLRHWEHYLITPFLQLLMASMLNGMVSHGYMMKMQKEQLRCYRQLNKRMNFLD